MGHKFITQAPSIEDNATTQPTNSYVRDEAQKLIDKQQKDLTDSQLDRIEKWSQGLKAIAAIKAGEIRGNNACKLCNSKGFTLVRGDSIGINKDTKKMEYAWEETACGCIRFKFTPTNLKGLKYEAPINKGKPAKKVAKPTKRPTGTGKTKKRTGSAK
jgi:hypothetical protein